MAATRPSRIQLFNSASDAGPYSASSPPMILYWMSMDDNSPRWFKGTAPKIQWKYALPPPLSQVDGRPLPARPFTHRLTASSKVIRRSFSTTLPESVPRHADIAKPYSAPCNPIATHFQATSDLSVSRRNSTAFSKKSRAFSSSVKRRYLGWIFISFEGFQFMAIHVPKSFFHLRFYRDYCNAFARHRNSQPESGISKHWVASHASVQSTPLRRN